MKIGFIGDIHGFWPGLATAVRKLEDADILIQVGDFGFWPEPCMSIEEYIKYGDFLHGKKLYWIDGNHEHFTNLKRTFDVTKLEPQQHGDVENLFYIPRGTILDLDGLKFGFLGGAWSIDHERRTEGHSIFRNDEQLNDEHWHILGREVDFMVTHDAPFDAYLAMGLPDPYPLFGVTREACDNSNQRKLQGVLENNNPKWWIHGHYHMYYETNVRDCEVRGLHMARKSMFGFNVDGAILTFDTEKREFID